MHKLVSVFEAPLVTANCVARYLNVNGVPTAMGPANGLRKLKVLIDAGNLRKAEKLLKKRGKSCGGDLKMGKRR